MAGIVEIVGDKRAEVLKVAARHGAGRIRIFGSVARGDAGPRADPARAAVGDGRRADGDADNRQRPDAARGDQRRPAYVPRPPEAPLRLRPKAIARHRRMVMRWWR